MHFLVGTAFIVCLVAYDGSAVLMEALCCLIAYVIYVYYLLREGKSKKEALLNGDATTSTEQRAKASPKVIAIAAGSAFFISLGADYTIVSLRHIAEALAVSPALVALTVLSVGTTLPELFVSAVAARGGKGDIAIGNILGSCIFNGLAIFGVSALVGELVVTAELVTLALPVYAAAALLFYLLTQDKKVSRWEGELFLVLYALFIFKLVAPAFK